MNIKKAAEFLEIATAKGDVEIAPGVWLFSQQAIIEEQKVWDDEDGYKDTDFTTSPHWIATDTGEAIGITDAADLYEQMKDTW